METIAVIRWELDSVTLIAKYTITGMGGGGTPERQSQGTSHRSKKPDVNIRLSADGSTHPNTFPSTRGTETIVNTNFLYYLMLLNTLPS